MDILILNKFWEETSDNETVKFATPLNVGYQSNQFILNYF